MPPRPARQPAAVLGCNVPASWGSAYPVHAAVSLPCRLCCWKAPAGALGCGSGTGAALTASTWPQQGAAPGGLGPAGSMMMSRSSLAADASSHVLFPHARRGPSPLSVAGGSSFRSSATALTPATAGGEDGTSAALGAAADADGLATGGATRSSGNGNGRGAAPRRVGEVVLLPAVLYSFTTDGWGAVRATVSQGGRVSAVIISQEPDGSPSSSESDDLAATESVDQRDLDPTCSAPVVPALVKPREPAGHSAGHADGTTAPQPLLAGRAGGVVGQQQAKPPPDPRATATAAPSGAEGAAGATAAATPTPLALLAATSTAPAASSNGQGGSSVLPSSGKAAGSAKGSSSSKGSKSGKGSSGGGGSAKGSGSSNSSGGSGSATVVVQVIKPKATEVLHDSAVTAASLLASLREGLARLPAALAAATAWPAAPPPPAKAQQQEHQQPLLTSPPRPWPRSDADAAPAPPGLSPVLLGMLTLCLAAVAVSMLLAAQDARSAAEAAAAAYASAAASIRRPAQWVHLDAMLSAATQVVQPWYSMTWHEATCTVLEHLSWAFQKWSYASLPAKIASVLASSVPLVMFFGLLYYLAVGGKQAGGIGIHEALIKIHCILNRMPGTNMVREDNAASFLVVNAAFFTGLFTFAVFLGIVSDEVKSTFRDIRTGAYPLRLEGHVLVVNWSHHTVPLLRQFGLARQHCAAHSSFFKRQVVLLADTPKQTMDNELAERLKSVDLDVVTRSGSPNMVRDLDTVAASRAHTIIVMHPGGASCHASAEAAKASTALALTASFGGQGRLQLEHHFGGGRGVAGPAGAGAGPGGASAATVPAAPHVLFQMPDELVGDRDPISSFTRVSPAGVRIQALSVTDDSLIDRFCCQAAVQPGMLRIWMSLLQHGANSVQAKVEQLPEGLQGRTFGAARHLYRDAVVAGMLRNGALNTNCDAMVLGPGDQLVLFTHAANPQPQPGVEPLYREAVAAAAKRLERSSGYNAPPKRVIVTGYTAQDVPDVAAAFADSAPEGSQLTFIVPEIPEDTDLPGSCGACRIRYVESRSMTSLRALQDAGIRTADAVILRPPINEMDRWCNNKATSTARIREADALVMAGIIQVQDAVLTSGRTEPPHLVARFNRYGATETARKYFDVLAQQAQPAPQGQALSGGPRQCPQLAQERLQAEEQRLLVLQTQQVAAQAAAAAAAQQQAQQQAAAAAAAAAAAQQRVEATAAAAAQAAAAAAAAQAVAAAQQLQDQQVQHATSAAAAAMQQQSVTMAALGSGTGAGTPSPAPAGAAASPASGPALQPPAPSAPGAASSSSAPAPTPASSVQAAAAVASPPPLAAPAALEPAPQPVAAAAAPAASSTAPAAPPASTAPGGAASASSGAAPLLAASPAPPNGGLDASRQQQQQQPWPYIAPPEPPLHSLSATHAVMQGSGYALPVGMDPPEPHPAPLPPVASTLQPAPAPALAPGSNAAGTGAGTKAGGGASSGAAGGGGGSTGGGGALSWWQGQGQGGGSANTRGEGGGSGTGSGPAKRPIIVTAEIFLADDIVAALLTQVAAQPSYAQLVAQLITRHGVELYLRNPAVFNIAPGEAVSFAELTEVTRQLKQVALGVMKADGRCCLVPQPDHMFDFQVGDQILVLGEDFNFKTRSKK